MSGNWTIAIVPYLAGYVVMAPLLAVSHEAFDRRGEPGFRALYTAHRDGTQVEFLAAAPGMISSATPEWSHDGARIAMDAVPRLEQLSESRIFVYHLAGERKGEFLDLGPGNVPTWSPDDHHIAFMLNPGNPLAARPGIWVMKHDGTGREWLCEGWYPRWSPAGDLLCIQDPVKQPNCLAIYDLRLGTRQELLGQQWVVEYAGATWSRDGQKLVFIGQHAEQEHLAVCDVTVGEPSVRVIYTEPNPSRKLIGPPTWSPDGKQMVFAIQESDRPQVANRLFAHSYLYSVQLNGDRQPRLLEGEEIGFINRGMMFSPDGQRIVFSSERPQK